MHTDSFKVEPLTSFHLFVVVRAGTLHHLYIVS